MGAKILFLSDLHKRDCDFSTIAGYTKAVDRVQHDILEFIKEHGITHLVSTGDWYDKGFRSINRVNNDRNLDEALSAAVGGNFYICLGNHFFLERDNNPEMYLIQPSKYYTPSQPIYATSPIIRAVPALRVGPVQISFFHYSKESKEYVQERDKDVKFHIGVYHDERVIPTYKLEGLYPVNSTPDGYLSRVYANIDLAIVGHIHTPIGAFKMNAGGHQLTMVVPGSLSITSTSTKEIHTEVKLPLIEIGDNGSVKCTLQPFSLHADCLKFYRKKEKPISADVPTTRFTDIPKLVSLPEYLRAKGFDDNHIRLVTAAAESEIEVKKGLELLGIIGRGV